jgi:hypothetical protein
MVTDLAYNHLNKPRDNFGQKEIFWMIKHNKQLS